MLYLFNDDQYKSKWLMTFRNTVAKHNMAEVWENQAFVSVNVITLIIAKNLKYQFIVSCFHMEAVPEQCK